MGSAIAQIEYGRKKAEYDRLLAQAQTDKSPDLAQRLERARVAMESAFEQRMFEQGDSMGGQRFGR